MPEKTIYYVKNSKAIFTTKSDCDCLLWNFILYTLSKPVLKTFFYVLSRKTMNMMHGLLIELTNLIWNILGSD